MVRKVLPKNYILLIVAVAQFIVVLDSAIVNVALLFMRHYEVGESEIPVAL